MLVLNIVTNADTSFCIEEIHLDSMRFTWPIDAVLEDGMNLKGLCLKLSLVVGVLAFSNSAFADFYNVNGHIVNDMGNGYYTVDGEMHHQSRVGNTIIDNGRTHNVNDYGNGNYSIDGEMHHQSRVGNMIIDNGKMYNVYKY